MQTLLSMEELLGHVDVLLPHD